MKKFQFTRGDFKVAPMQPVDKIWKHVQLCCERIGRSGPKSIALVSLWGKISWKFHYDRIIFTQVFERHSQNTFSGLSYKRVDESSQKIYDAMPDIIKHAPEVSTRAVNPYARESSPEKLQQDGHRQTDEHTDGLSKTFLDVSMIVSQILFFAWCQYFHETWKEPKYYSHICTHY